MNIQKTIRSIMKSQGVTLEQMGARTGVVTSSIANALGSTQKSMGVERVLKMASSLGYDMVLVPKGSKLPSNSYVIDKKEDY